MIINKYVKTLVGTRTFKYFKELGYEFNNLGDEIEVSIEHLNKGSHLNIEVCCDYCNKKYSLEYKRYVKNKITVNKDACNDCRYIKLKECNLINFGCENVFQNETIKERSKITNLERYGFDNPAKNEVVKKKYTDKIKAGAKEALKVRKKTNIDKFGVEFVYQSIEAIEKIRNIKVLNGFIIPDDKLTEFEVYKRNIRNKLTSSIKRELFSNWDGYDYYDNEYIKENLSLTGWDRLYPSIDHKISIYYGFMNNIPENEIYSISNLCITKRWINSSKNRLSELEYLS